MAKAAHTPTSAELELAQPLPLDCGQSLEGVRVAYETYGTLAADKANAILICHATTGPHGWPRKTD